MMNEIYMVDFYKCLRIQEETVIRWILLIHIRRFFRGNMHDLFMQGITLPPGTVIMLALANGCPRNRCWCLRGSIIRGRVFKPKPVVITEWIKILFLTIKIQIYISSRATTFYFYTFKGADEINNAFAWTLGIGFLISWCRIITWEQYDSSRIALNLYAWHHEIWTLDGTVIVWSVFIFINWNCGHCT